MSHDHAANHGPDHVPHVSPLSLYIRTWLTLMVLTVITVAASYVDIGSTGNLVVALIIATVKASLVAAFFMHLLHDHKLHLLSFVTGIVFLILFIGFTMMDTEARGQADPVESDRTENLDDPFSADTKRSPADPPTPPTD